MPIKRNPNIKPLSREHHHGLLFCWKLVQGEKLAVDVARVTGYIDFFWKNRLKGHFDKEEQLLFKLLDDPISKEGFLQHETIRQQIDLCLSSVVEWLDCMKLSQLINSHIRFEERVLFPHYEKNIPQENLVKIGSKLADQADEGEDGYLDEFWVKST